MNVPIVTTSATIQGLNIFASGSRSLSNCAAVSASDRSGVREIPFCNYFRHADLWAIFYDR